MAAATAPIHFQIVARPPFSVTLTEPDSCRIGARTELGDGILGKVPQAGWVKEALAVRSKKTCFSAIEFGIVFFTHATGQG